MCCRIVDQIPSSLAQTFCCGNSQYSCPGTRLVYKDPVKFSFFMFGLGLIVWYHGPVPVDYIGLVARLYQDTGRMVVSVTDRSLEMLPGLDMFRHHMKVGPFTKIEIAELLDGGELVGVAPGGARECLFDHNCEVLWGNRSMGSYPSTDIEC